MVDSFGSDSTNNKDFLFPLQKDFGLIPHQNCTPPLPKKLFPRRSLWNLKIFLLF
uniref:Uncharacterized protein n=1 Tax=Meloidogyne enterolobii TaxID=390850 RepID=A0A6V7V6V6_MELEN|nr:unnamed protein product [Meloidogyne enterolobii]